MAKVNVVAKDLRTPKYKMRVVKCRKVYRRKAKHPEKNHVA
jgi:hypothetical protein